MTLILASASPRRRELLESIGVHFAVDVADVDESPLAEESPEALVERLALVKARTVLARRPADLILAADTAVVLGDAVFGKPIDPADARRMLRALSGRPHRVLTGVALVDASGEQSLVESTTVWFSELDDAELDAYVASGEPMDKAGAYGIQGLAARFIPRIDGSHANVVGLPVSAVWRLLQSGGRRRRTRSKTTMSAPEGQRYVARDAPCPYPE
jgi:septum formation protein